MPRKMGRAKVEPRTVEALDAAIDEALPFAGVSPLAETAPASVAAADGVFEAEPAAPEVPMSAPQYPSLNREASIIPPAPRPTLPGPMGAILPSSDERVVELAPMWRDRLRKMADAAGTTPAEYLETLIRRAWVSMPLAKR